MSCWEKCISRSSGAAPAPTNNALAMFSSSLYSLSFWEVVSAATELAPPPEAPSLLLLEGAFWLYLFISFAWSPDDTD